ncbi:Hypothetical protein Ccan_07970 [Capnocytophaga canimorsus Cc5]|uniref:Lipoprotein n=3 Tax=Capnocytophaga canimorsus TaxID=28188 RepID=F9YTY1_CAPCC|nr:hypothetical protein [Capnocytophaga canimorsus]AEK22915.1 Hypothetical protein Ccan_07970 [Capnocytophaga canimorsus Cc5]CEN53160.1 conserved exported hypothetical protein [Capnocytophaga canimorsus]
MFLFFMKNFAIFFLLSFFVACNSSSNKVDFFGDAYYNLHPQEKVLNYVTTPVDDLFKQVVSSVFKEQQLPVYRIVKSENAYTYITIPFDISFSNFSFDTLPQGANIIHKNENNQLKYIAFESNNILTSIYLRKIKNNTICLLSFSPDKTKFEEIGSEEIIDKKIQFYEK